MIILSLIISFLGGGIVSGLIGWIYTHLSTKEERKLRFLTDQIRNLYGPLHLITSEHKIVSDITKKMSEIYNKLFIKGEQGNYIINRKRDYEKTINMLNEYYREFDKHNKKIIQILEDNYSYMDIDDVDIFEEFYSHYIRGVKEFSIDTGIIKLPIDVYKEMGRILSLKPDFIKRIDDKYSQKKEMSNKLMISNIKSKVKDYIDKFFK